MNSMLFIQLLFTINFTFAIESDDDINDFEMGAVRDYRSGCTQLIVADYALRTNLTKFIKEYGTTIAWACNIEGVLDCGAIQKTKEGCVWVAGSDPTVEFLRYNAKYHKMCDGGKVKFLSDNSIHKVDLEKRPKLKNNGGIMGNLFKKPRDFLKRI